MLGQISFGRVSPQQIKTQKFARKARAIAVVRAKAAYKQPKRRVPVVNRPFTNLPVANQLPVKAPPGKGAPATKKAESPKLRAIRLRMHALDKLHEPGLPRNAAAEREYHTLRLQYEKLGGPKKVVKPKKTKKPVTMKQMPAKVK